ncbi:unnamed protein product [Spirodela intermedia]|uniref:Uncharacterized protein n=1 Tax=Spirodela intermedia TaxID=51605 RepID=A0A7I8ILQ5_SPIIN|nr:unnamed protein product [Spirodela intermedia]CAA6658765.1 unnamed protein product [Spirodela intermedia]
MGRTPCCEGSGLKKGPWTPEEDILLVSYVKKQGPGNWKAVPAETGLLRCSKSCRLRWTNYLRPGIKRGNFSSEEEKLIVHLQALLGNRTDNDIKNHWNTHLKKKLRRTKTDGGCGSSAGRGRWERKLQEDIHVAERALREALSPESSAAAVSEGCNSVVTLSRGQREALSSTTAYAYSSAENISRLLKGWPESAANSELTHLTALCGGGGGGDDSVSGPTNGVVVTPGCLDHRPFSAPPEASEMSFFPQVDELWSSLLDTWFLDDSLDQPLAPLMAMSVDDNTYFI